MIQDSGARRTFESGAVRDIQEGKGRCDLLPVRVASRVLSNHGNGDLILAALAEFLESGETHSLYSALSIFAATAYAGSRETMMLEVSKHFEEGALKYGENNWQKGLPPSCYIDSAIRHYIKWRRGDSDEPHDRALVWNLMCCIWEVDHHVKNQ